VRTTKITIADNQELVREGVKSIIDSNDCFEVLSIVSTKDELFELVKNNPPSILIIDPETIGDFSVSTLQELTHIFPVSNVLVLTSGLSKNTTLGILAQGITHLLLKTCSVDELVNAMMAIIKNEDFLCKYAIEVLLKKNSDFVQNNDREVHLTKKEVEIIRLVSDGFTTKDIAKKLFLSGHTVNTHRRNILKKLDLNNTSELVMYAVKTGIVEALEYYI
jgi:DNA-binding NarL/FixJ family response regulator